MTKNAPTNNAPSQALMTTLPAEQASFYHAVWHGADAGMCVTDVEGTYLEVNEAYCRMCGYERSELLGAKITRVLAETEQQAVLEQYRAFLLGQEDVYKGEFQFMRKDGSFVDIAVSAALVHDKTASVFAVTTVTDLTERNALLQAERHQRQLSDAQAAVLAQVVSQTDVCTVLDTVLMHVNALVSCDASSIALLEIDDDTNDPDDMTADVLKDVPKGIVRVAAWRNNHRETLGVAYQTFCAPLALLKLEQATLQRGAIIVADVYSDPRLEHDGDRGHWVHSFATIPLRVKNTVLGWLWLDAEAKNAFDQAAINALQPFVDAAAIALRNAQLYDQSQRQLAEKERVQHELARSEAHMRKLLQALPDGFVRHDPAGHYLEVHVPEGFRPVKPAETLIGKTIDEVLPASVVVQMHRHLEQLFATGQMQKQEYVLEVNGQTHFREVRWVRLSAQEAFGLVRDITEQKYVEEALKQREALFRSLFESSALGIALIDDGGRLVDVNAAFCRLLGYERHELIGLDPKTITHPDDVALTLTFTDSNRYQIEKRFFTKQGQVLWVLVSATRLQLSADQPVIIIKHVQDISAQKKLEQALQASQQRLESIVITLPDVVLTLAADNTVTFSNASANGVVTNDVVNGDALVATSEPTKDTWQLDIQRGQDFKTLLPADVRPTLLNAFERVRSRGGMAQLEVCLPVSVPKSVSKNANHDNVNDDASHDTADCDTTDRDTTDRDTADRDNLTHKYDTAQRWFLLRVRPGEAGSHELVVVMTDISDIKRSTIRLERALEERTTLLKEIHHRVKNNMQVISSLLHLRGQTLANDEQGQVARASLHDSRERIRAMALVHEVMYETDHFDAIDFHVYLNKLLRMVMRVNRIGDVHLALSLEPVTLHIDQAIPCGLIANELLSNALKHAFDDDQRQREIRVEVRQQEDDVSLYVIDNGVGLPATMPENHLGMTIIESLVTQLEGTLTFTNRQAPEQGLIASVCFPNVLPTTTLD